MILDLRNALAQATEKIKSDAAIYDEYVKKDFKRPCFFLRLLKLTGRREMAGRYLFTAFWQIKYYPRLPVKGEPWRLYRELNDLALKLYGALAIPGYLVTDMEHQIEDNTLVFSAAYSFYAEENENGENNEKMIQLEIEME